MPDLTFTDNPQVGESTETYLSRIAVALATGAQGTYTPKSTDLAFSNAPQTTDSEQTKWGRIAVFLIT